MFTARLRKSGNRLIVTVPKEEAERLHLEAGQTVLVEVHRADKRPKVEEVRAAFEESWERNEAGYRYLAGQSNQAD